MKQLKIPGVYQQKNKLFTINLDSCEGLKVYNEKLINSKGVQYRSWNPYRSKLATLLLKGELIKINPDSSVLYLGAATGTTVSHISDIVKNGIIYAVENSAVAIKKLTNVAEKRQNIIPILTDANHPDRYTPLVSTVDLVYQDISQRNQAEIFIKNISRYLKNDGMGVLIVKARSIDVSLEPEAAYEMVSLELKDSGLNVERIIELSPYEKDHAAIIVSF